MHAHLGGLAALSPAGMAQYLQVHPDNPQPRLVSEAVQVLRGGGVIVYPTDSGYALGCCIGDKAAQDRIRRIRQLDEKKNFTLVCRDLSELSGYANVDNTAFRLMKSVTPGPYTFILKATHEVPRRLQNPRRKTIGIRVPDNNIARALLEAVGEPLMSSTLTLPGDDMPLTDPDEIRERLNRQVDLIIDGGYCGMEPTTVVDLMADAPVVVRRGRGDAGPFE
jgi:tRNA threonylcarbamoyl adenosine modification protein (Sua5/YciO/YrdC/YwlC family)